MGHEREAVTRIEIDTQVFDLDNWTNSNWPLTLGTWGREGLVGETNNDQFSWVWGMQEGFLAML